MEVQVERLPESRARLTVTVPVEDVTKGMDSAFQRLVGRYNIPGFRRGKTPRPIFERYVGKEAILREAAELLVEKHFNAVVDEAGVVVVGEPSLEYRQVALDQPIVYALTVFIRPEVTLGDGYRALLAEPLEVEPVTDVLLEEELKRTADGEAQLVEAEDDDPIAVGSRVVLALSGRLDNDNADEESFVEADDYMVEVGTGTTVEGLETQLIGLHRGDSAPVRFTYPEDYPDPTLAQQAVVFDITVKEHKRRETPSVDDELAKAKGYETLQELRDALTNTLAERLTQEAQERRLQSILGKLRESVSFDVPVPMAERAVERQLQDLEHTLSHLGATLDQYLETRQLTPEGLAAEVRPTAVERVKDQILLEEIAKAEALTVSDDEVMEAVRPVAESYRQSLAELVDALKVSGEFEAVRQNLLVDKAAKLLRESDAA
jgi:trigger factor